MARKATLDQVRMASNGRMVTVESDVFDVAQRIAEVDPSLGVEARVFKDERGHESALFRVYEDSIVDGVRKNRTVFWVEELTPDLPDLLRQLSKTPYVKEMERMDAAADREADRRLHERVGPIGERLAHALRKDMGYKGKAFIPRDI